jgi:hypothetical protein
MLTTADGNPVNASMNETFALEDHSIMQPQGLTLNTEFLSQT